MYLVNSRVDNLFPAGWEMKELRDNAGEVLRNGHTSGVKMTTEGVLRQKGLVFSTNEHSYNNKIKLVLFQPRALGPGKS